MKILDIATEFKKQKVLNYKDYKITTDNDTLQIMKIYFKEKLIAEYQYNPFTKSDLTVFSPNNSKELHLVNSILEVFNLGEVKRKNGILVYLTYEGNLKEGNIKEEYFSEKNVFLTQ